MKNLKLKTLLALILSVWLVGCGGYIPLKSIEKATKLCEDNGGIDGLSVWVELKLIYKNGAEFGQREWFRTAD